MIKGLLYLCWKTKDAVTNTKHTIWHCERFVAPATVQLLKTMLKWDLFHI